MKGQPDAIIVNNCRLKLYNGFCIEFKSPSNNYQISEAKLDMKKRYEQNGYKFSILNDYDLITLEINEYLLDIRIPCRYCEKSFKTT